MTVSFDIPDPKATDIINTLATRFGWEASDGAKGAFVKAELIKYIRAEYRAQKEAEAGVAAGTQADSDSGGIS